MRKTKNFNIQVPELGDVPDITQVSNAIQDLEDALAGTLEIMDASIQGSGLTLSSVARQTKRTKYYDGMSMRFLCPQTITSNTLKTVVVDDLPQQVITVPFDIIAGEYVDITYRGTSFTAHPVMIQKSESIDSNSNETVATSRAVKKLNENKLQNGGYTGTAKDLLGEITKKATTQNYGRIKVGKYLYAQDGTLSINVQLDPSQGGAELVASADAVKKLNDSKLDKTGGKITGNIVVDVDTNNNIILYKSGQLKGIVTTGSSYVGMYNSASEKSLQLNDDGSAKIEANNLNTNSKEVISAINELRNRLDSLNICPYNVGDVYITTKSGDPSAIWSGTSWKRIEGKFLLATSGGGATQQTGGSSSVTLGINNMPSHNHSASQSSHSHTQPAHYHGAWGEKTDGATPPFGFYDSSNKYTGSGATDIDNALYKTSSDGGENTGSARPSISVGNTGGGQAFSIMPPYFTVHVWVRMK